MLESGLRMEGLQEVRLYRVPGQQGLQGYGGKVSSITWLSVDS